MLKLMMKATLLGMILMNLISCGDLFSKKEEEKDFDQFASCEMNTESLSLIMREKIKGELDCLEHNLSLFIDIVKTDKPGYLSQKELKTFITDNLSNVSASTLSTLDAIFDLSSIFFGDKYGYIKKSNVSKLVTLLKDFNALVVENRIYEFFSTQEKVTFEEHNRRKSIIYNTMLKVGRIFSSNFIANQNEVNLVEFIKYFEDVAEGSIIEKSKSLLFVKKGILGGSKNVLTSDEITRLALILGDASKIIYDFINVFDIDDDVSQDEEIVRILKEDVETTVAKLYYRNIPNEPIFTLEDLAIVVNQFMPEYAYYLGYKDSILKAKKVLLKGEEDEVFTSKEVKVLFEDILFTNLNRGSLIYRAYRENKDLIEHSSKLFKDIENITTIGSSQRTYKNDFNRILLNYRFFRNKDSNPLFDFDYRRSVRGVFEISFYEDLVARFFSYYGEERENVVNKYVITMEKLETFMLDFKDLFEGENWIYPGRAAGTAQTITLVSSLFHTQSNGDSYIEVPEFTEFVITMLSSLDLSSSMFGYMTNICPLESKTSRYNTQCFRDNFRPFLNSVKASGKVSDSIPQLFDYLTNLDKTDYEKYMNKTAKFSRTCTVFENGDEVPMSDGDGIVTWAGLLVIEQSMIRFDINKNKLLEPSELDELFKVFKPAVEAMIPVEFLKKYSHEFFKYIVKYERVPEVPDVTGIRSLWRALKAGFHFVKFLFKSDANQNSIADRMTYASVLEIIAENSPSVEEEEFDCETLK